MAESHETTHRLRKATFSACQETLVSTASATGAHCEVCEGKGLWYTLLQVLGKGMAMTKGPHSLQEHKGEKGHLHSSQLHMPLHLVSHQSMVVEKTPQYATGKQGSLLGVDSFYSTSFSCQGWWNSGRLEFNLAPHPYPSSGD